MSHFKTLTTVLLSVTIAMPALASNGFTAANNESGGQYHAMPGGKTRGQVQAELDAAIKDGSLAKMNSEAGYAPEFETPSAKAPSRAAVSKEGSVAKDGSPLVFEAPAAGAKTRQEVLRELQRAREDGSLRLMNTNRGF